MKDSVFNTIKIALILCVVCSIFVSTAAVVLKPSQEKNKILDRKKNILLASQLLKEGENVTAAEIDSRYEHIKEVFIDLKSGELETNRKAKTFDEQKESKDPNLSIRIDSKAGEGEARQIAKKALIYNLMKNEELAAIILPVKGKGLWSTLYGFLCLNKDTRTVIGLTFYEHAETPGLGGEVDNPNWKALWPGRVVLNEEYQVDFEIVKGKAGSVADAPNRVDGLSGATITARGVSSMIRFWVGPNGYGPYLAKVRDQLAMAHNQEAEINLGDESE